MEELNKIIVEYFIAKDKLADKNRSVEYCNKRWFLQNFLHKRGMKLIDIGSLFNQNHSSVISGLRKYQDLVEILDPKLLEDTAIYRLYLEHTPIVKYDLLEDIENAVGRYDIELIKKRIKLDLYK